MRTASWIVTCCVSFVVGAVVVFAFITFHTIRVNTDWVELTKPVSGGPVTYTTEAIFKSDISLPDIKQFSGKAKFITDNSTSEGQRLGYLIHVIVPPLDLKKVPEKYLKEKPVEIEGVKSARLSIEQVTYEIAFTFTLKDNDGFTLAELTSPQHTVKSGKDNEFQDIALKGVSREVAARTKTIAMQLGIQKCLTCQGE